MGLLNIKSRACIQAQQAMKGRLASWSQIPGCMTTWQRAWHVLCPALNFSYKLSSAEVPSWSDSQAIEK